MMSEDRGIGLLLAKTDKRTITKYIQFSKRIVASIVIAATLISAVSIGLLYAANDTANIVQVVKAYTGFATVGFISYSLNSVGEKFIKAKYVEDEQENG